MKKQTTPHLQQGGTDDENRVPEWALSRLRDDPELLREVAALVVEMAERSPDRRR